MSLLPEVDPFYGITTEYEWDEEREMIIVKSTQTMDGFLDVNREQYNNPDTRWRKNPEKWMKVASIPNVIIHKWMQEGLDVWTAPLEELRRKLNDPDYRYLKVTPLRV